MCADEHNQQFLLDKSINLGLVIAGSGGTELDFVLNKNKTHFVDFTEYMERVFGFAKFNFAKSKLTITFRNSETQKDSFQVEVSRNDDGNNIYDSTPLT